MTALHRQIAACRICADALPHKPRPVVQFSSSARLLIIGQAPGSKVHGSGVPWDDASGDRLCEWTGLSQVQLHDPARVALVPMGFCYPGKGTSGDLPPRRECAPQWHSEILAALPADRLTLLVGTYGQQHYLPRTRKLSLTDRVRSFEQFLPNVLPLPHPSWRITIWMRKNSWFERDIVPILRRRVARAFN